MAPARGASEAVDVAIVGGGLVGASLAVALAPLGLDVVLIEAAPQTIPPRRWDERCIGLNAASVRIFQSLGVWDEMLPDATAIASTHISERGRFGTARFTAKEAGLPALGYNTPLRSFAEVFERRLPALPGLRRVMPATVTAVEPAAGRAVVSLATEAGSTALAARLVVAADGAESSVRSMLGIGARRRGYGQSAIVSAVRPQRPLRGCAYERFLPTGPLALLPKPDDAQGHAASLVWTLPTAEAERMCALANADYLAAAQDGFGERVGRFLALGRRGAYPLTQVMAESLYAPRAVLIGNAAQSLHPVAAQGFNLGLRDVAQLAELLAEGGDPGEPSRLQRYAALRAEDREQTCRFTDRLVRLFSNELPGLSSLRHLGLAGLDILPGFRRVVMQRNLGFGGRVPLRARRL